MGRKIEVGEVLVHSQVLSRTDCTILAQMIERHKNGDWGDISQGEKSNNDAVKNNTRIVSAYFHDGEIYMVMTEGDRRLTLVVLLADYNRVYGSILRLKRSQTKDKLAGARPITNISIYAAQVRALQSSGSGGTTVSRLGSDKPSAD